MYLYIAFLEAFEPEFSHSKLSALHFLEMVSYISQRKSSIETKQLPWRSVALSTHYNYFTRPNSMSSSFDVQVPVIGQWWLMTFSMMTICGHREITYWLTTWNTHRNGYCHRDSYRCSGRRLLFSKTLKPTSSWTHAPCAHVEYPDIVSPKLLTAGHVDIIWDSSR